MVTTEAHIGEKLRGKVTLFDASGNPGASYDEAAGIVYESTDPAVGSVVDEDADPLDCEVQAIALGTTMIRCTLDTRRGTESNQLVIEGELSVVPGEARSGTL